MVNWSDEDHFVCDNHDSLWKNPILKEDFRKRILSPNTQELSETLCVIPVGSEETGRS